MYGAPCLMQMNSNVATRQIETTHASAIMHMQLVAFIPKFHFQRLFSKPHQLFSTLPLVHCCQCKTWVQGQGIAFCFLSRKLSASFSSQLLHIYS